MNLTRRQLLKNGLLMGGAVPFTIGAAWASQAGALGEPRHGAIRLYGIGSSVTELGLGLRQQGWAPQYEGHLDPLTLNTLPNGTLAAGFTDEAGLVLLTSLLAGRGRILALGRHEAGSDHLISHRGVVAQPLAVEGGSWQSALGREYARLALASSTGRHASKLQRTASETMANGELSFLVQL